MSEILVAILIGLIFYYRIYVNHKYWRKKGCPYSRAWPLVGNFGSFVTRKRSILEILERLYKEFPSNRYSGINVFSRPCVLLRDLRLIKEITVRNFDSFSDRYSYIDHTIDPPLGKHLFNLPHKDWKVLRPIVATIFSRDRIDAMLPSISECCKNMTGYFVKSARKVVMVEIKAVFTKLLTDILARIVFGVDCDTFEDPRNEFYKMSKHLTRLSGTQALKVFLIQAFPGLSKIFNLKVIPQEAYNYFHKLVRQNKNLHESMKQNSKGTDQKVPPSFVQHLIDDSKPELQVNGDNFKDNNFKDKTVLNEDDITIQAMSFFLVGFDMCVAACSFMAYELANNFEVQQKLKTEIDVALADCNDEVTIDVVEKLEYLDQVVLETLRLWPPVYQFERKCLNSYTIQPKLPTEKQLVIDEQMAVVVPIASIQKDPKYFPNPENFDPGRFSQANMPKLVAGSYMPFGVGPRNCIGYKLALLQIKAIFINLLSEFEIIVTKKTGKPLKLSSRKINPSPEDGFWLGLRPRIVPFTNAWFVKV